MGIEEEIKAEAESKEEVDALDALAKEEKEFNKVRRHLSPPVESHS